MERTRIAGLQLLFGWLNLVLAVPSIYLMFGMPLVMRQYGSVSYTHLTLPTILLV